MPVFCLLGKLPILKRSLPSESLRFQLKPHTVVIGGLYSLSLVIGLFNASACGESYTVLTGNDVILTSPGFYKNRTLQPGVLCKWEITTNEKYSIVIDIKYMQIFAASNMSYTCDDSFVTITGKMSLQLCNMESHYQSINSYSDNVTILLKTGHRATGKGFRFNVSCVMKRPGPPLNVKLQSLQNAVMLTWQPPAEVTFPITAYHIRYVITSTRKSFLVTVSANMRNYPVNTRAFEGKLMKFNITALIGRKEGTTSRTMYSRARMLSCSFL